MSFRRQLVTASAIAWVIVSIILMLIALAPFLAPADALAQVAPQCSARRTGSTCVLCGMTTAFLRIGEGDADSARASHPGSLVLWSGFVLNFCCAGTYSVMTLLRKQRKHGG